MFRFLRRLSAALFLSSSWQFSFSVWIGRSRRIQTPTLGLRWGWCKHLGRWSGWHQTETYEKKLACKIKMTLLQFTTSLLPCKRVWWGGLITGPVYSRKRTFLQLHQAQQGWLAQLCWQNKWMFHVETKTQHLLQYLPTLKQRNLSSAGADMIANTLNVVA